MLFYFPLTHKQVKDFFTKQPKAEFSVLVSYKVLLFTAQGGLRKIKIKKAYYNNWTATLYKHTQGHTNLTQSSVAGPEIPL